MAGGSGNCGSAAAGAAASVVIANLISGLDQTPRDTNGDGVIDALTVDQQNARVNLITTLVAALASGTGLDAQVATTSAAIEAENNKTRNFRLGNGKIARIADGPGEGLSVAQIIAKFGIDNHPDLKNIAGAYGTRDPEQLQAIVNLIAAGKSATEIKAVQADAAAAYGKDTPEAKAALVDIANGRSTTQELAATAQARSRTIDIAAHLANVRTNYDIEYGAGSYDALIAKGKIEDAATQARVDAAQARFDKEIGCVILCPAAIALAPIIAAEAGIVLGAKFGGGLLANTLATGTIAGGLNVGAEFGTNALTGEQTTTGGVAGAFTSGFVFGGGFVRYINPATGLFTTVRNGTVLGAASGAGGNGVQQATDKFGTGQPINTTELGISTLSSGLGGGLVAPIGRFIVPGNPFGINRFEPTFKRLETNLESGIIQNISTTSAVKGAVGAQVGELPKTAGQAAIDAAKKKLCAQRKDGCK